MWIYSAGGQFFTLRTGEFTSNDYAVFLDYPYIPEGGIRARIGRLSGIYWIGVKRPRSLRMKYVS